MFGFHWADLAVLFVYLVGTTAIGVWLATRVHGMGDFFMPRRFGMGDSGSHTTQRQRHPTHILAAVRRLTGPLWVTPYTTAQSILESPTGGVSLAACQDLGTGGQA